MSELWVGPGWAMDGPWVGRELAMVGPWVDHGHTAHVLNETKLRHFADYGVDQTLSKFYLEIVCWLSSNEFSVGPGWGPSFTIGQNWDILQTWSRFCPRFVLTLNTVIIAGLLYDFLGVGRQHQKASRQCVNTTLDCCMTLYERWRSKTWCWCPKFHWSRWFWEPMNHSHHGLRR